MFSLAQRANHVFAFALSTCTTIIAVMSVLTYIWMSRTPAHIAQGVDLTLDQLHLYVEGALGGEHILLTVLILYPFGSPLPPRPAPHAPHTISLSPILSPPIAPCLSYRLVPSIQLVRRL